LCLLSFIGMMPSASRADDTQVLALVGCKVYPSPTVAPLDDAAVAISGGTITAIGKRDAVSLPKEGRVIDCAGKTVVAGFWNSHVHFPGRVGRNAASAPAPMLSEHMQDLLTRWGVTTVWDLGSNPFNSLALRRRVEAGEVPGPRILLTGSIFPKGGHPVY